MLGGFGLHQNFRIEGPAAVLYFRGDPHVHAFINIGMDADAPPSVGELIGQNPAPLEAACVQGRSGRATSTRSRAGRTRS